jgi:hypothetical protein
MPPKKKPPPAEAHRSSHRAPAGVSGRRRLAPSKLFDAAAGKDEYEPEKDIAKRLAQGTTQYQVKWANCESKHNTWEPKNRAPGFIDDSSLIPSTDKAWALRELRTESAHRMDDRVEAKGCSQRARHG